LSGVVLDTGALIAWERANRAVIGLVAEARRTKQTLTIPAGCVAQTWRDPRRQARPAALVKGSDVDVVAMDATEAQKVGLLLADAATSDIADGHVALCALRLDAAVVTSDPEDIRRLGPGLRIRTV
jgi:predicted nucleic acid-binding protein